MQINNNHRPKQDRSDIEILLESLNKNKKRTKTQNVQQTTPFAPAKKSGDAVEFELSPRAKSEMRFAEIDDVINSGEPLTGVDFKEFQQYYSRKHGYMKREDEMQQLYRQALKGDNASLREHEWLHNPNYILEPRLYSSTEVTEDREAALEQYKSGAELTENESRMLSTFPNMLEASTMLEEINYDRLRMKVQAQIGDLLSEAGIELAPDTELSITTWGRNIEVSGSGNEDTDKQISDILSSVRYPAKTIVQPSLGHRMENLYFHYHRDVINEVGFERDWVKASEMYLEDEGSGVSIFDLSLDEEGNVVGIPEKYEEFIKEYAVIDYHDRVLPRELQPKWDQIREAIAMREAFKSVVHTIQNGDYDKIKGIKGSFTYKNGVIEIK